MLLNRNNEESSGAAPMVQQGERSTSQSFLNLSETLPDLPCRSPPARHMMIHNQTLPPFREGNQFVEENIFRAALLISPNFDLKSVVRVHEHQLTWSSELQGTLKPTAPEFSPLPSHSRPWPGKSIKGQRGIIISSASRQNITIPDTGHVSSSRGNYAGKTVVKERVATSKLFLIPSRRNQVLHVLPILIVPFIRDQIPHYP